MAPTARFNDKGLREMIAQPVAFALSFRGDAKHRTGKLEIPGLVLRTIPE
jgi:hypothetical protein